MITNICEWCIFPPIWALCRLLCFEMNFTLCSSGHSSLQKRCFIISCESPTHLFLLPPKPFFFQFMSSLPLLCHFHPHFILPPLSYSFSPRSFQKLLPVSDSVFFTPFYSSLLSISYTSFTVLFPSSLSNFYPSNYTSISPLLTDHWSYLLHSPAVLNPCPRDPESSCFSFCLANQGLLRTWNARSKQLNRWCNPKPAIL